MKKILLAFDGSHYSTGALAFVQELNKRSPVMVTGAFLPQVNYSALWSYSGGGQAGSLFIPLLEDEDATEVQQNMQQFELFCRSNKIAYTIHKDFFDFALPQIKAETRFADLLVLSSERFYEQAGANAPNDYLKEVLHSVECPVVVVPETFEFPVNNILAYDGTPASVYAIKQFAYLFPELTGNKTELVYATEKEEDGLPHQHNIDELATRHYNQLTFCRLEANPRKEFSQWLEGKTATLLVCGSFGGSVFSNIFHRSFATDVIKLKRFPIFIAHK